MCKWGRFYLCVCKLYCYCNVNMWISSHRFVKRSNEESQLKPESTLRGNWYLPSALCTLHSVLDTRYLLLTECRLVTYYYCPVASAWWFRCQLLGVSHSTPSSVWVSFCLVCWALTASVRPSDCPIALARRHLMALPIRMWVVVTPADPLIFYGQRHGVTMLLAKCQIVFRAVPSSVERVVALLFFSLAFLLATFL